MSDFESETGSENGKSKTLTIHSNSETEMLPTDYLFWNKRITPNETQIQSCEYEVVVVPDQLPSEQPVYTPSQTQLVTVPTTVLDQAQKYPIETIDDSDGKCSAFYNCCYCFAKRFVSNDNRWVYKRIGRYVYNTTGQTCIGLYNYETNEIYDSYNIYDDPDVRYCTICFIINAYYYIHRN